LKNTLLICIPIPQLFKTSVKFSPNLPACSIVQNDLILNLDTSYRASYPGTGVVWKDLSSRGIVAYLTPPNELVYSGDNGGFLVFNCINAYVSHSPSLQSGQKQYTICGWWKTTVDDRVQVVWEQNSATVQSHKRAALLIFFGRWGFNGQNNDAHYIVPVRVNQWTYGVITVDTTLSTDPIKIYENGKLYWQGNTLNATKLDVGIAAAGLGRKIPSNNEYFVGNIAQVSVYNRVLTSLEIEQNYNLTRAKFYV
jgi:hypothetical protein